MPTGPRILLDNVCYHIIVRGNHRLKIFKFEKDYEEYLNKLRLYKKRYKFKLYAYCLMPNHIHFVCEVAQKRDLVKFMQGINRSYTAYFNELYGKEGHLWQGRYKNKILLKDQYLINCVNYVEQNPVRAEIVSSPLEYKWSSYKERVLEEDMESCLLNELPN